MFVFRLNRIDHFEKTHDIVYQICASPDNALHHGGNGAQNAGNVQVGLVNDGTHLE